MRLLRLLSGVEVKCKSFDGDPDIKDVVENDGSAKEGSLFIALRGEKYDGNDFIDKAVESGCAAVLTDTLPAIPCNCILVQDARAADAVIRANQYGNPQRKLKLIAVTGTNGKTTVTHMIYHILSNSYGINAAALCGGVNNIIGGVRSEAEQTTPSPRELYSLMAEAVASGAEYFVCEASSHALAYKKFEPCRIALGIFTNFTEDHLDFHGTMGEYFACKCSLIGKCDSFLYNGDDKALDGLNGKTFSLDRGDYTAYNIKDSADGIGFDFKGQTEARISAPVRGEFNVYNALCAVACAEQFGVSSAESARALASFKAAEGRFEIIPLKNGASCIIDFAHTPDALENALRAARGLCGGKLYCVFGCGGDRDRLKRPAMGRVVSRLADIAVVTSDNSRSEQPADIIKEIMRGVDKESRYVIVENRRSAILYALENLARGDVLLLCGKGHEKYEIDMTGKHKFSEKDIINEYEKR